MKKLIALLLTVFLIVSLAACGAKYTNNDSWSNGSAGRDPGSGSVSDKDSYEDNDFSYGESVTGTTAPIMEESDLANRKIIKEGSLSAQTENFDEVTKAIREKTAAVGGFVQGFSVSGTAGNRYAHIEVRIPAEKFDTFTGEISETVSVTDYDESIQDVTMTYTDIESHITALRTEQETLLGILEKAEDLDSVIKLQGRLSELRAEIESYESQKRLYDSLISYSTLTVFIREVARVSAADGEAQSVWQEIGNALSDNLYDIGQGFRAFFIWFVGNIPYFAIVAVIAVVIVIIVKATKKKNVKKMNTETKDTNMNQ